MQFDVDLFYILAESLIAWSRSHKESPSVLVILQCLDELRPVSYRKSSQSSLLDHLLLLCDALRVSSLKLIPQLSLNHHLISRESRPAERTSLILDDQCSLREAILAEDVLAFDQPKRLIEDAEADGALVVLQDLLMSLDLCAFHQQLVNKDASILCCLRIQLSNTFRQSKQYPKY